MRASSIVLTAVLVTAAAGAAVAQIDPLPGASRAAPEQNVQGGAEGDSGAGLEDEARQWIGAEVKTSDGKMIGKVTDVLAVAPNSDAGELVVTPAAGGATIEVPIRGASYDGTTVTVTSTEAELRTHSN